MDVERLGRNIVGSPDQPQTTAYRQDEIPWVSVLHNGTCEIMCLQVFTRGQFWPSGIVVACVCLYVRPSVRPCVR